VGINNKELSLEKNSASEASSGPGSPKMAPEVKGPCSPSKRRGRPLLQSDLTSSGTKEAEDSLRGDDQSALDGNLLEATPHFRSKIQGFLSAVELPAKASAQGAASLTPLLRARPTQPASRLLPVWDRQAPTTRGSGKSHPVLKLKQGGP